MLKPCCRKELFKNWFIMSLTKKVVSVSTWTERARLSTQNSLNLFNEKDRETIDWDILGNVNLCNNLSSSIKFILAKVFLNLELRQINVFSLLNIYFYQCDYFLLSNDLSCMDRLKKFFISDFVSGNYRYLLAYNYNLNIYFDYSL